MNITQNIWLVVNNENELILDGQSKILNWLYNYLIDLTAKQYEIYLQDSTQYPLVYQKYGLRNYVVNVMKKEYPFLNTVYSKPIKECAMRVENSFKQFFKKIRGCPDFRAWKKKWFSLYYDESFIGYKIVGNKLILSCGKDLTNDRIKVEATLTEKIKDGVVKSLRLCKKLNRFYISIVLEKEVKPKKEIKTWISIDQNHKNFFCAIDYKKDTYEFSNNDFIKYIDNEIDKVKSKLSLKKKFTNKDNKGYDKDLKYKIYTKQYQRLKNVLDNLYIKRREQKKTFLNTVANYLYKNYDLVIIGDYVPDTNTATKDNMHRSMLNQSMIGELRYILQEQADKCGKHLKIKSERNTTSDCSCCGSRVYKDPKVRYFVCEKCGNKFVRDLNSCLNIGKEEIKMLSGTDYLLDLDLSLVKYSISYSFKGIRVHELNEDYDWSLAKII